MAAVEEDRIKKYLDCFMISKTDTVKVPEVMNDTGTMVSVVGMIFSNMKVGEIANNILFQLTRFCNAFGTELEINIEEVKRHYTRYMTLVSKEVKGSIEQIQKEDEKEPLKKD